jgi:hypothetical protein
MEKQCAIEQLQIEYEEIRGVLDERGKRRWCAARARSYNREFGRGGVTLVSKATGVSRSCIYSGIEEIEEESNLWEDRIRKRGGGRKKN